jgi:hypothetical protein
MMMKWVGSVSRDLVRAVFRDWFGLQDNQADLLVILWEQGGGGLKRGDLCAALNSHRRISAGALYERVRGLRAAMEVEAVDFDQVRGYRLTEVGMAECARAIREVVGLLLANEVMAWGEASHPSRQGMCAPR